MASIQELLEGVDLNTGRHAYPEDGMSVMELTSFLMGSKFTDRPVGVCPVVTAFAAEMNDYLPQEARNRLLPYVSGFPGTAGPRDDEGTRRGYLLWMVFKSCIKDVLFVADHCVDPDEYMGLMLGKLKPVELGACIRKIISCIQRDMRPSLEKEILLVILDHGVKVARSMEWGLGDAVVKYGARIYVMSSDLLKDNWGPSFAVLERIIDMEPRSKGFPKGVEERVNQVQELLNSSKASPHRGRPLDLFYNRKEKMI